MRIVRFILPLAAILLLALPAAARAGDPTYWLVLRDGRRLAATGELEVNGRTVRFRAIGGTLSSMPLEQVDLAATRTAFSPNATGGTPNTTGGTAAATPRQARNIDLKDPAAYTTSAVGLAGEAAKRAGRRGSFIDLTGIVVPRTEPAPAAPSPIPVAASETAPAKAVAPRRRAGPKTRPLADPEKLLRLRLQRLPRAPS